MVVSCGFRSSSVTYPSNLGSDSPRVLSSVGPWTKMLGELWGWFNENSFDLKMLIYKDHKEN
jgi:hypothetical protein